jgi:hypothetical protein
MVEIARTRFSYDYASRIAEFVYDENGQDYWLIDDFYYDEVKIAQPCKSTLLHTLIVETLRSGYEWETGHFPQIDHYKELLADAGIKCPKWMNIDDFDEHVYQADKLILLAIEKILPTVFNILFSDRNFLFAFQKVVSKKIGTLKAVNHKNILKKDGVLKRPKHIPTWLRSAIYYRDKGHCQLCGRDITGLLTPTKLREIQLDHIIPLKEGGSNDPTNFQLTCQTCNGTKSGAIRVEPVRLTPTGNRHII